MKCKLPQPSLSHVTMLLITGLVLLSRNDQPSAGEACTSNQKTTAIATGVTPQMTLNLVGGLNLRLANIEFVRKPDLKKFNAWIVGKKLEYFSTGRIKDRHNNLLAQVLIHDKDEIIWLQAHLLANGDALASALPTVKDCFSKLAKFERSARRAGKGIWSDQNRFRMYGADELRLLNQLPQGSFQIIEGRVHSVGNSRKNIFINFSNDWKTDFTLLIEKRIFRRKHLAWPDLNRLKGKTVRARGWLDHWHGPMIRLHTPEMLQILQSD